MPKKTFWVFILLFSAISALFLIGGFTLAIYDIVSSSTPISTSPTPKQTFSPPPDGLIVGLGDSVTRGIGDPQGKGALGYAYAKLKEKKKRTQLVNLSISGQTSPELLKQLQTPSVQQTLQEAQWIVLSIGGNDLFQESDRLRKIHKDLGQKSHNTYRRNLSLILQRIREQNQTASIFLFEIYNPFIDLKEGQKISQIVLNWNQSMQEIAAQNKKTWVVPTFDLFQHPSNPNLAGDHFHPNQKGYQQIGVRLHQLMQDAVK